MRRSTHLDSNKVIKSSGFDAPVSLATSGLFLIRTLAMLAISQSLSEARHGRGPRSLGLSEFGSCLNLPCGAFLRRLSC